MFIESSKEKQAEDLRESGMTIECIIPDMSCLSKNKIDAKSEKRRSPFDWKVND